MVHVMTFKFGTKIDEVEDRLNEYVELVRKYDEVNGIDPVPDAVKKACIVSNTPEPLRTHLQLNAGKMAKFDGVRVAAENYRRSRRIFKPEEEDRRLQEIRRDGHYTYAVATAS